MKAKRDLEKTSRRIEFSFNKYFLLEDTEKKEPLVLKEIRNRLSEGSLKLDDILISGESDRKTSIRTLLSAQIGLEPKAHEKTPPRVWSGKNVIRGKKIILFQAEDRIVVEGDEKEQVKATLHTEGEGGLIK